MEFGWLVLWHGVHMYPNIQLAVLQHHTGEGASQTHCQGILRVMASAQSRTQHKLQGTVVLFLNNFEVAQGCLWACSKGYLATVDTTCCAVLVCVVQVRRKLRAAKLHVDVDNSDRTMQKKVREAQLSQYNYILVVGEQEKVRRQRVPSLGCRGY
jgi:histidyl-tRNA synthetase